MRFGCNISLAQDLQYQTLLKSSSVAVFCSIVANSGSLFIAKRGVKFPHTVRVPPVGCGYSVSTR